MFTFFLFNTLNFIVHVLVAYPAFIMGWLILDSKNLEKKKSIRKVYNLQTAGFWMLGVYLLLAYAYPDAGTMNSIVKTILTVGMSAVALGYYIEPMPIANSKSTKKFFTFKPLKIVKAAIVLIALLSVVAFILNLFGLSVIGEWFKYNELLNLLLAIFINIILWVKYTVALQKQHKSVLIGFHFLSLFFLSEVLSKLVFQNDLRFAFLTQKFGGFWMLGILALAIGFFYVGKYAISFLRFRLKPQLFISFIGSSLIIFFLVTVVFLVVLINDFQKNTLNNLQASSKAIELSIVEKRNATILAAKALSDNEKVVSGVRTEESKILAQPVQDILTLSGIDFIIVTNEAGLSIYNTYDKETYGENFSTDKYIKRAMDGIATNTLVAEPGVLSPTIVGKTYIPVVQNERVIGAIITGYIMDDQLVDSIKKRTGLDISIFSQNIRTATTFTTEDGLNRLIGTIEDDDDITTSVLAKGETYQGVIDVFNIEHLAIYTPLKDADENIIGMIFVGEPSQVLISVADKSVQSTLQITTLLILLSLIPTYFIVRKVAERQIL